MAKDTQQSRGIGFTGVLLIAFIVLKLLGKITWSWWWVLSPAWIATAVVLLVLGGAVVVAASRGELR